MKWYDYAVLRIVPRVERGEFVNVGVIVFSREADFLGARVEPDWSILEVLGPNLDRTIVDAALESIRRVALGDLLGGPIAALSKAERFHWLTAPRSTVIQPSPVHTGRAAAPERALDELFEEYVA